jgi:RNA polymerase sigma factor (TIGR02999 family)
MDWQNRAHFLAMAARLMRRILVDSARAKRYQKRGGGGVRVTFTENLLPANGSAVDLIAIDDALHTLAVMDERRSRVIELRFFGGFSVAETAELLQVSPQTVMRDWRLARIWLAHELTGDESSRQ